MEKLATELGVDIDKFNEVISKLKLTILDENAKADFEKNFGKLKYDEGHKFAARNFARDLGKKLGIESLTNIEHYGDGERILTEQFKKLKVPITENEEFKAAITSYEQKLSELQKEKQSIFNQRIIDKFESEKQKAILSVPCQVPTHIQNMGDDAVNEFISEFYENITLKFDKLYTTQIQDDGTYKIVTNSERLEDRKEVLNNYKSVPISDLVQSIASKTTKYFGINNTIPQGKGEGDKRGSKDSFNTRAEFDKWVESQGLNPLSKEVTEKLKELKQNPNFK